MLAVIDYGMGNLYSVKNALDFLNIESKITGDAKELHSADGLILPGVGAFPDAMDTLREKGLASEIVSLARAGKPLLGICLGMQLLLEESEEVRPCKGLGLIGGRCVKMSPKELKIPHIGWNDLSFERDDCPILEKVPQGSYVYFVHSYMACLSDENDLAAYTVYGGKVPAVIQSKNVIGAQFHPEKSGSAGLSMLSSFAAYVNGRK